jgi:hypothetical protein
MKLPEPGSSGGTVALCERCGEEIVVANDLDRAGDVDPPGSQIVPAGKQERSPSTGGTARLPHLSGRQLAGRIRIDLGAETASLSC